MKRTKWWINLIEWISISYFSNNYIQCTLIFSNFEKDLDSHWVLYCVWISHFSLQGWDVLFTLFDNLRVGLGVLEVLIFKFWVWGHRGWNKFFWWPIRSILLKQIIIYLSWGPPGILYIAPFPVCVHLWSELILNWYCPFQGLWKAFKLKWKIAQMKNKRNLKLSHPLVCAVQPLKRSEENPDQQFVICQSRAAEMIKSFQRTCNFDNLLFWRVLCFATCLAKVFIRFLTLPSLTTLLKAIFVSLPRE